LDVDSVGVSGTIFSNDRKTFFNVSTGEISSASELGKVNILDGSVSVYNANGNLTLTVGPRRIKVGNTITDIGGEILLYSDDGNILGGIVSSQDKLRFQLPTEDGALVGFDAIWRHKDGIGYYIGSAI
jgi:hypothetical protein